MNKNNMRTFIIIGLILLIAGTLFIGMNFGDKQEIETEKKDGLELDGKTEFAKYNYGSASAKDVDELNINSYPSDTMQYEEEYEVTEFNNETGENETVTKTRVKNIDIIKVSNWNLEKVSSEAYKINLDVQRSELGDKISGPPGQFNPSNIADELNNEGYTFNNSNFTPAIVEDLRNELEDLSFQVLRGEEVKQQRNIPKGLAHSPQKDTHSLTVVMKPDFSEDYKYASFKLGSHSTNVYLTDDLISYYKLDETSGDVIDSHGDNDGTNYGATRGVTGKIGNAFDFNDDNEDYFEVNHDSSLTSSSITVNFWAISTSTDTQYLIDKKGGTLGQEENGGYMFGISGVSSDGLSWTVSDGNNAYRLNSGEDNVFRGQDSITMITLTYDDSSGMQKIYLNSNEVASNDIGSGKLSGSTEDLRVGLGLEGSAPFQDWLDGVGIWGRALSDSKVSNLYNNGDGLAYDDFGELFIDLLTPENNFLSYSDTIDFSANVTDPDDVGIQNVSLVINENIVETNSSGIEGVYDWDKTLDDGDYNWTVIVYDNESELYEGEVYDFIIDTEAPNISIESPTGTLDYGGLEENETLNTTITDDNLEDCWYNYNGTNKSFSCSSGVKETELFELKDYKNHNLTVYANDSLGNTNSSYTEWEYKVFEHDRIYKDSVVEGTLNDYILNVTIANDINIDSAIFHYENETEISSIDSSGNQRIISIDDFIIPDFPSDINASFFWELRLDDDSTINTSTRNQSVSSINLDDCSSYSNKIFNLSLHDEETLDPINGTIEVYYEVLNKPYYDVINSISGKFENTSNTLVCSDENLSSQDLAYSAEVRYYSKDIKNETDYVTELYHIQQADIEGIKNLELYDLSENDSTEFEVEFQDRNLIKVPEAVIQLQRKYIGENLYRTVEAPITSQDGKAKLHIDMDNVKYKVTVVKNGEVLDIFDNVVFSCENELSGSCNQNLYSEIDPDNERNIEKVKDFSYSITSSNNSVTVDFSVPSGVPSKIRVIALQKDQFGNNSVCNESVTSSAGSLTCYYEDTIGESYVELRILKDNVPQAIKTYLISESGAVDFLGNNFFIVFIFLISIIGMAFTSPEWIILNGVVVMVFTGAVWLLNGLNFVMGLGGLAWLILAAGLLIFKIAKQEDR